MAHQVKLLGRCSACCWARARRCRRTRPRRSGRPFNEDAKQGYVALAGSTWDAGDWDFIHFDRKAEQAMLGDEVWPDRVASRLMPAPARDDDAGGARPPGRRARGERAPRRARARPPRRRSASTAGSTRSAPAVAPTSTTGCKETFMAELAKVEARLRDVPDMYAVFFETGSALLERAGAQHDHRCGARGCGCSTRSGSTWSALPMRPARRATTRRWRTSARSRWSRALLQAGVPAEMINIRRARRGGRRWRCGAATAGSTSPSSDRLPPFAPAAARSGRVRTAAGGRERLTTHRQPFARGDHAQVPSDPAGPGGGADRRRAGRAVPGPDRHLQAADRQAGRACDRPQPDDRRARSTSRSCRSSASRRSRWRSPTRPAPRARRWCASRRCEVELKVWPLLRGTLEVDRFVLVEPQIDLEVDAQGQPNWQFGDAACRPAGAAGRAARAADGAPRRAVPAASSRRPAAADARSSSATSGSRTAR